MNIACVQVYVFEQMSGQERDQCIHTTKLVFL
jgi:hypothetical protein